MSAAERPSQSARQSASEHDRTAMGRAIALARRAEARVAPNPRVGCVLIGAEGAVIGEGWHQGPGTDHAETMALKGAGAAARGARAYVTLEPCNHTGRTGPCAAALIDAGVDEVVFAVADPNPLAAGGASRLREAGIAVRSGVYASEAAALNRDWLFAMTHRRPFVTAKTAMTLDGRIATHGGESQWITSPESRAAGHRLRLRADAIATGVGTVIADDPAMTARFGDTIASPRRIVFDSQARSPAGAKVFERSDVSPLLITTRNAPGERLRALREHNVTPLFVDPDPGGLPDIESALDQLFGHDIHHLMLEAGGALLGAFFDADLIDELHLFIAPKIFGGGRSAFMGRGIGAIAEADRFHLEQGDHHGPDQHWIASRKGRTM